MKIDAPLRRLPLAEVRQRAAELEQLGVDSVWGDECQHDPFLPMPEIALGTEKLQFGTNIAIAFTRAPFSIAMTAWDLQKVSGGRFLLGLGTQVRAHIERRFSTSFDHPAARVTDYIHCLRAIWDSFQNGTKPNYHGRFYQFTLNNDLFNPGPIGHPDIEVYLAGVNPRMARAAGEAADGFCVHPMHSPGYLRDIVKPAIGKGAQRRGKTVTDVSLLAETFIIRGETETERRSAELAVRQQVAFYASTPSYRTFLDYHGHGDLGKPLSAAMRNRDFDSMLKLITDNLLAEVAVSEADGDFASLIRGRYDDGLVQRVTLYDEVGRGAEPVRAYLERL